MHTLEVWQFLSSDIWTVEDTAIAAERDGWDGLVVTDSQNLSPDPYISLCLAAKATSSLKLGTGVTNPVTRHPAVTANVAISLQELSGGRMVLGIGRGDSALFNIGRQPAPLLEFQEYVRRLQSYLRGESFELNHYPSEIRWLKKCSQAKVPVEIAGTGPKVLAFAAAHVERISLAMGADLTRLGWAVKHIRSGKIVPPPSIGAYINVCVCDDRQQAIEMVRAGVGTFAHFSGMKGAMTGTPARDHAVFQSIEQGYDKVEHGSSKSQHAQALPNEFIERFAITGPPQSCIEKLRAIMALGIERLIIIGPHLAEFPEAARESRARFVNEVLPHIQ